MEFNKKIEDGKVVVTLSGYLDTAAAEEVSAEFENLQNDADKEVIIDLTPLEYISSAGLRLFVATRKNVLAKGGKLAIKGMNSDVHDIFRMTGFLNFFEVIE